MNESRNLIVNPKPDSVAGWTANNLHLLTYYNGTLSLEAFTGNSCADLFVDLPAGEYVYRFDAVELTGYQNNEQFALLKVGSAYQSVLRYAAGMDSLCTDEFTLDTAANIELLIVPPGTAGGVIRARRFMISSKNDYAAMLKDGVTWFDGDGAVKN